MENLEIYNKVKEVPKTAQKEIKGGRLNGFTDINPMWRIQVLTELFGPCGIGWKYTIDRQWLEEGSDGNVCSFCNVSLYVLVNGTWSDPIPGTGGSSFVAKETKGLKTSDEAFKMALTDALGVACKALGVGAKEYNCCRCGKPFEEWTNKDGKKFSPGQMYHISETKNGEPLCIDCSKAKKEEALFK